MTGPTETNTLKPSDPRNKLAASRYVGVHVENYRGHTLKIKRGREWGTFETFINGHHLGTPSGTTNGEASKELDNLHTWVDHAFENPSNYHNGLGEYSWSKRGTTTMPKDRP